MIYSNTIETRNSGDGRHAVLNPSSISENLSRGGRGGGDYLIKLCRTSEQGRNDGTDDILPGDHPIVFGLRIILRKYLTTGTPNERDWIPLMTNHG
jgi:hypothetical protein